MARKRRVEPEPEPETPRATIDVRQCVWLTRGQRCLMIGASIYGSGASEHRYCSWHEAVRAKHRPQEAESFEEFERWCLAQRAGAYCGRFYEFSHADIHWLWQVVTGDERVAPDPPWRVACAKKTACYYAA